MYEVDVAIQLLAMLKARYDILGPDIAALGEHSWILILQMFVRQTGDTDISEKELMPSNLNPRLTKRIMDLLVDRNILEQNGTPSSNSDISYQLTQPIMAKIETILAGALAPTK